MGKTNVRGFAITIEVNESKRYKAWNKHAKVKNNKKEFFHTFDKRVYELGLKVLGVEKNNA